MNNKNPSVAGIFVENANFMNYNPVCCECICDDVTDNHRADVLQNKVTSQGGTARPDIRPAPLRFNS